MTTEVTAGPVQFVLDGPPVGGVEPLKFWTYEMLQRLVAVQQQPRVQSIMFAAAQAPTDAPMVRPAPGMFVYAAAEVVAPGKPVGLYIYLGGVWKQLQVV